MRFLMLGLVSVLLLVLGFQSQVQNRQERHAGYTERAEVRHLTDSATVSANDPRPLAQAIRALSEEYAWLVDFEDLPYYSKYDLVDDTAPEWRSAHPAERGATVVAGRAFQSEFSEDPKTAAPVEEERILNKVVSDYNNSGNPGKFIVRDEGDGRFAIVGISVKDESGRDQPISAILDTQISVPTDTRDALTTIEVILDALSVKTKTQVGPGTMPLNALLGTKVTMGGQDTPARTLLLQTLSATDRKLCWYLYYDHDVNSYALNLRPLVKAEYDASGNRKTVVVQ